MWNLKIKWGPDILDKKNWHNMMVYIPTFISIIIKLKNI